MAVIQNPIIGRAKNKFSNAIFSTWVGKNVLRSKPLSVANPRTDRQITNRERIAFLARVAKATRVVILNTLRVLRSGTTQYNVLSSLNYPKFEPFGNPSFGTVQIRPRDLVFSTNTLDTRTSSISAGGNSLNVQSFGVSGRETLEAYAVFFRVEANTFSADPVLSVEDFTGDPSVFTWEWNRPADASAVTIVLYDRLTGQSAQFSTENF